MSTVKTVTVKHPSAANTNLSFDSNGRVGICNSLPSAPLHVNGSVDDGAPIMRFTADTVGSSTFQWISASLAPTLTGGQNFVHLFGKAQSTPNSGYIGYRHSSDGSNSNVVTIGLFGSNNLLNVYGGGYVTLPGQPAFHSYRSATWSTSNAYVTGWSQNVNIGGYFNNSTGTFTAPVAGTYTFFWSSIGSSNSAQDVYLHINGSKRADAMSGRPEASTGTTYAPMSASSGMAYMNAGDYANLWTSGPLYSDGNIWLRFGGWLIG